MDNHDSFDSRRLEILAVLWENGRSKPADIQARLSFPTKNSALRWLLNELVDRGDLVRHKDGKAYVYEAVRKRRPVMATLFKQLRDSLFGGSSVAMLGELIETQKLSDGDLQWLQKLARQARTQKSPDEKG